MRSKWISLIFIFTTTPSAAIPEIMSFYRHHISPAEEAKRASERMEGYISRAQQRIEELSSILAPKPDEAAKLRRYHTYLSQLLSEQLNATPIIRPTPIRLRVNSAFSLDTLTKE